MFVVDLFDARSRRVVYYRVASHNVLIKGETPRRWEFIWRTKDSLDDGDDNDNIFILIHINQIVWTKEKADENLLGLVFVFFLIFAPLSHSSPIRQQHIVIALSLCHATSCITLYPRIHLVIAPYKTESSEASLLALFTLSDLKDTWNC